MSEEVFSNKYREENGDLVEIHIWEVPTSEENPAGLSYSFAYIRQGERLVGYDNFEGHEHIGRHHKHLKERIIPYEFKDIWGLFEDFNEDIEKIKKGIIT